jgi:hypothetical protein
MPVTSDVDSALDSGLLNDSWLTRALARRDEEVRNGQVVTGARFNSFI